MTENNKAERELFLDRIIEATKGMNGLEYLEFMKLSGPERLKRAEEILKGKKE